MLGLGTLGPPGSAARGWLAVAFLQSRGAGRGGYGADRGRGTVGAARAGGGLSMALAAEVARVRRNGAFLLTASNASRAAKLL